MMEHHVLDRPLIVTERRRPSVRRPQFDEDQVKIDIAQGEDDDSVRQAAPPIPEKEGSSKMKSSIEAGRVSNGFLESEHALKQAESPNSVSSRIPPKVPPRENILYHINIEINSQENKLNHGVSQEKQSFVQSEEKAASAKWAKVLGYPLDEKTAKQEKKRVQKLAKKQGATRSEIKFIVQQIVPFEHQQVQLDIKPAGNKVRFPRIASYSGRTVPNPTPGAVSKT